jgi:hypothetical protein
MEVFLNLLWLLLCFALVGYWTSRSRKHSPRGRERRGLLPLFFSERRAQIVALLLLIVLLFPVISLTDDLVATQTMAETDHLQQRLDALRVLQHHAISVASALPTWMHGLLLPQLSATRMHALLTHDRKQIRLEGIASSIEHRPPPSASIVRS